MSFLSALGQASPGGVDTNFGGTVDAARRNYDTATSNQNDLLKALNQVVSGQTPSLAEQQLLNTTQANANAAAGAIASQQGINPGLAARQIQQTAANLNQQEVGQAAANRIAEQQSARGLIAQILQGQTGTDTSLYGTAANADLNNQQLEQNAYKTNLNAATNLIGSLLGAAGTAGTAALGMPKLPSAGPAALPSGSTPPPIGGGGTYGDYGVNGPSLSTTRLAHGGEVTPSRTEFLTAYMGAHPDMQKAMLAAWHAGKEHGQEKLAAEGGEVEGHPATQPGDNEENDTNLRLLSDEEVVLPRTVSHDPELAAAFVERNNKEQRAKGVMHRAPVELFGRSA